ncbi:MAG: hypothetical protein IK093_05180 [Ruminiclostridium sp.]|nr:hypothetical protein [Ruminiclostridium sp.]
MKTAKELFERLRTDEAFAKEFDEAIKVKREAGAESIYEMFIPVAAERDYELSKEELDEAITVNSEELSPEELGKVAGGSLWMVGTLVIMLASSACTITAQEIKNGNL